MIETVSVEVQVSSNTTEINATLSEVDVIASPIDVDVVESVVEVQVGADGFASYGVIQQTITLNAASILSALKAIAIDGTGLAIYADSVTAPHAVGISTTAGTTINVQISGTVTDALWSWTPGQMLYVGTAGTLTSSAPTGGAYVLPVARALTATTVLILNHPTILTV